MKLSFKLLLLVRKQSAGNRVADAFTLVELLVVVCVLALLAATLVPTFAGSRTGSQTFRCLNNNRQLAVAWRMYADDSSDRLVYANPSDASQSNTNRISAWATSIIDFTTASGNWDTNVDIVKGPLWSYTSKDASIYRCPSDHSYVVTGSGVAKPRVRSFAMNLFTGGFAPQPGAGPAGTDGGLAFAAPYRIFSKSTDLTAPGPARTFVFIDTRPEAIIYPEFITDMAGYPSLPAQYTFYDFPGIFHNLGASVSFADGRAEIRRWVDPRTAPPMSIPPMTTVPSPNNLDIAWLQARATSLK
jgi:type II secretory pathway pseudopilin PulG